MTDKEVEEGARDIEPSGAPLPAKQHGLFGSSGIQLTDDELASVATTKFLRHINGNQEAEIQKLRSYESQFFDKRQECEVLKKEKEGLQKEISSKKDLENLQKVMISLGSIMLGTIKFIDESAWYVPAVVALVAVVLIVGGLFPVLRIGASK